MGVEFIPATEQDRCAGFGGTVQFEGQTWRVAGWELDIIRLYGKYLVKRAWDAYHASEPHLKPSERAEVRQAQIDRISTGAYDFTGSLWVESLFQPEPLKYFAFLLLERHNPAVKPEDVRRLAEAVGDDVLFQVVMDANADPRMRARVEAAIRQAVGS